MVEQIVQKIMQGLQITDPVNFFATLKNPFRKNRDLNALLNRLILAAGIKNTDYHTLNTLALRVWSGYDL